MTSFGPEGLLVDRFNEIESNIQTYQRQNISKPFKYQDDKLIFQLNSVFTRSTDQLNQLIEAAFSTLRLSQAEGFWLDELGLLRGVTRLPATASYTTTQYHYMTPGQVIPAGTRYFSDVVDSDGFNPTPIAADFQNSFETYIGISTDVSSDAVGTIYTVTLDGVDYSYTKQLGDNHIAVSAGLAAEYDSDAGKTWTYEEVSSPTFATQVFYPAAGETISFTSTNTRITPSLCKMYGRVELTTNGPLVVEAKTMDQISVPSVNTNNDSAYVTGRARETDAEFRQRIANGPTSNASGTVLAIENDILENVANVSFVRVIENITDFPTDSDGRRYSEIETLVVGGDDTEVAQEFFRVKGAGIPMFGNTTVFINDDKGYPRTIKFSRPTEINIAYKVEYQIYSEEALPSDAEQSMTDAVLREGTSLTLGEDVIWTRFIGPIYQAVPTGLGVVNVFMQVLANAGDPIVPANWTQVTTTIAATEFASTTESDITVVQV